MNPLTICMLLWLMNIGPDNGVQENLQPVLVELRASDATGVTHTISFGFHPDATEGYDLQFGELPVPPAPFDTMFDVRFLDPPGKKRVPPSGSYVDIRGSSATQEADTFHISLRTRTDCYPLVLAWSESIGTSFHQPLLLYSSGDSVHVLDMARTTSWKVTDPSITSCRVVVKGSRPGRFPH